jgi:hypothetical protein
MSPHLQERALAVVCAQPQRTAGLTKDIRKGLFDDSESLYRAVASRSLDLQGDVVVSH